MVEKSWMGDVFALATAVSWSIAIIFFKLAGRELAPVPLKIFQNLLASSVLVGIGGFVHGSYVLDFSTTDWLLVIGSAVLGISMGDTFYVAALNRLGAGHLAIIDALYAPFIMLWGYFVFHENLNWMEMVGGSMIVAAVIAAGQGARAHLPQAEFWTGFTYGFLSQLGHALCVVMVRDILVGRPVMLLVGYRYLIGTLILVAVSFWWHGMRSSFAGFSAFRVWPVALAGTLFGPIMATVLWFSGFKYTLAGRAAVYNQMAAVFVFVLAYWILKEPLTRNKMLAILLAAIGGILMSSA